MPVVTVGEITITEVSDGFDGPALQIISSAAGFTYQDGVASPADQTISFTLLRQGLDSTTANWAASGATLETNSGRVDITEYIFGLPGTGDGDTAYLTLAQFGTSRQMSIGATVGSLAAYANVSRLGESTAQAGATRNVLSGDWVTATAYSVGDIVVKEGFRWVCLVAHVSSGSLMPPVFPTTTNTYWKLYGARGALTTSRAIAGSSWVDADAATAISDAGGVSPIQGDVVTLFNTTAGYSETRIRSSAGSWTALSVIFGGNVIVDNTLTASKIRAGAITADKVLITGRGSALNDDPTTSDISAWTLYSGTQPTIETITGAAVGRTAIRGTNSTWVNSRTFAVDVNKKYRLRCWARRDTSGTPASGTFWLRAEWFDSSGTSLSFSDVASTALTSSWLKRDTGELTPPANAVSARVMLILNYGGTTGYHEAQDVRFEEIIGADLIVDGSISALKLSVNSVTAGKIEAGAITADKIAAGAVTASKIAVGDFTVQARNWNFEEGDVGWSKEAGWTVVSDATNAKSGAWVGRGANTSPSAIRNAQKVAVEAGETFYAEAYIKHVSATGTGTYLRCNIYNSAGAEIGYGTGNTIAAATTTYTKSSVSFTVPANAATIDIGVVSNITGGTAYVDEARLFRTSNTTLIANGAITTDKIGTGEVKAGNIFAGAVTADKIAAGSITASKIAIGDFQNLCPNPSGETGVDGWTSGVVTGPNTAIGGLTATVKSLRTTNRDAYIGPWFDVTPGDQFYLSGSFYPAQAGDNPPTADAAVMMRFADDVGGTNSVWSTSAFAIRTTNSWQTVEGNVTVPAGKRFAMMALQINGTAGSTGSWHFRNIQVRRRNSGALIVDGAITAAKIDTGAVTAAKVSAGAITTSKLLVVPASICPDPYFTDEAWWTSTLQDANGWYFETGTINVPKQVALWAGAATPPGTTRKHLWSGNVTAPAVGSTLRLRARVANSSNHAIYVAARFYNAAGSSVGTDITLTSASGSGTQDLTAQGTVPANTATIRFIIYNEAPGAAFTSAAQVSAVMLDVAASADLIVDGAVTAAKISAGAITTDKLLVTGRGAALNDDPVVSDISAWTLYSGTAPTIQTLTDGTMGRTALRASNSTWVNSRTFAVDVNRKYRLRCWARRDTDPTNPASGTFWLRAEWFNGSGTSISFTTASATALTSAWTRKDTGEMTPPAGAVSARVMLIFNYGGTTGYHEAQDVRFEEIIGADLIVDGAIVAGKLAANSIAVGTAAIENLALTNAMIANTTITNAKIADLSVAKLTGAAMQVGAYIQSTNYTSGSNGAGWRINADGTAELQAAYIRGQVTASQINSNGLSIKDASGNVILAAGSPLAASNITPASGWLNSNVSIDSNGNIQGIGTGVGQSVANNVDSRINAPGGGIFTTQSPSISGAVRIRLPARVNIDAPMVTFTVDIYEYISGYSTTLSIAGHTFGTSWYNVTAQLVAGNIEYPVYFGHDGTYFVIWIGAASETWAYPQVFVSNVLVGFSAAASSLWASNWAISFDTSAAANVTQSVLDTYPAADWSKTARRPANLSGLSGSEAIQNTQITISGGALQGIGTGAGTAVANDQVRAGGVNLVGNSGFLRNNGLLPTNWGIYNNGNISVTTSVQTGGMFGQNYYRVTSNAATTETLGLYISGVGNADSVKSWEPGQTYCISYWARGAAGAVGKQMNGFNSNMGFTGGAYLDNPALTNQWQRYVFRGVPNSNASTPAGELFISWLEGGTLASGSVIDICCPKVELGTQPSAWTPSPQDTLNNNIQLSGSNGTISISGAGGGSATGVVMPGNQITSLNISTYMASAAIGDAYIANTLQSTNWNNTAGSQAGWQINKAGTATFNQLAIRGEINGGAYTGYAWPASGTGFHVGPSGILIGNYNVVLGNGKRSYFQIEASGNVYSSGFNVVDGVLSASIINTDQLVGGAAAASASATSTGASVSVTVSVPANASAMLIQYFLGPGTFTAGSSNSKYGGGSADVYGPVLTGLTDNGNTTGAIIVSPSAGNHTITVSRDLYTGTMRLGVVVLKR